jgi:hypothetical protein
VSKKSPLPQTRRHVFLFDEDWAYLLLHYGPDSVNKVGVSETVKSIIHAYVKRMKARVDLRLDTDVQEPASKEQEI